MAQKNHTKRNISTTNAEILELKKKIQLAEGQRKALFEDCEAEKNSNAEEIARLKKENDELVVSVRENSNNVAKLEIQKRNIERLIGPLDEKSGTEITELLDLQLIDKVKQLDLLNYQIKRRRGYLSDLGKKYQILLSEAAAKDAEVKIDVPIQQAACEIQNGINAVEVQLREAEHVRKSYQTIKNTLQNDAANFESKIKKIEDDLTSQHHEIDHLRKILEIAILMRNAAKKNLLEEEKKILNVVRARENQLDEGKRLVSARKMELENLEKNMFVVGKKGEPSTAEERVQNGEGESDFTIENLEKIFEKLKSVTGAPNAEQTLEKFSAQKETQRRLEIMKVKSENEKTSLQKQIEQKNAELEFFKFAQVKEAEKKSSEVEMKKNQILELQEKIKTQQENRSQAESMLNTTLASLQKLYIHINPTALIQKEPLVLLENLKREGYRLIRNRNPNNETEKHNDKAEKLYDDEKWLPAPYVRLTNKTPVSSASPAVMPTTGSDEEEVPSRNYLKRQAQMVIDAKTRKKNIKMQQLAKKF